MSLIAAALDSQLSDFLAASGPFLFYLVIWGLVFAGTGFLVGLFLPILTGDSLLFAAGLISARTDNINIVILAVGTGIAAFMGDQVGFVLGRKLGRPYLERKKGARMQRAIARTEIAYEKFGWFSVVISRFIPVMRAVIPVIAGVAKMNYYTFLSANLVGALAWGTGMTFIGYFAATIPAVKNAAYVIAFAFITAALVVSLRTWIAERKEKND
jgi:membrane-associated protein